MQYSYYAYLFHQFLVMYNISYSTPSMFMERFDVFTTNMEYVDQFNAKPTSLTLGMGPFADQTLDEFARSRLGLLTGRKLFSSATDLCTEIEQDSENNTNESVPLSFHWRDRGVLTPIKDQGSCGSCWAFASIEVAESVAVLGGFFENPPIFSPKQLVDCCEANFGCSGGYIDAAFQYMVSRGVVNESSYAYLPHQDTCSHNDSKVVEFTPRGCFHIGADTAFTHLSHFLMEKGPLVIAVAARSSVFQLYTGGVIRNWDCGTEVDHAVQLVGFGQEEDGLKYWVVRNSWGEKWGENGFFRLERAQENVGWDIGDKSGTCGMMVSGAWGLHL
jgi:C1A family cysteine protease